jgi:hypothetical protein
MKLVLGVILAFFGWIDVMLLILGIVMIVYGVRGLYE